MPSNTLRRDRRRRRPQRPDQRGVPRQVGAQRARARAPRLRRRRRDHRGAAPGLLVHHVLLRAEPAAARDHPGARAGQARLHAAADADPLRADGRRRLPAADRGRAVQRPGDRPAQQARRRRLPPLGARPREGHPAGDADVQRGPARHLQRRPGRPGRRRLDDEAAARGRPEDAPRPGAVPDRELLGPDGRLLRVRHRQVRDRLLRDHRQQGRPDVAGFRARAALPPDGRAGRPARRLGLPQGWQRRLHPGAAAGGRVLRGDRARGSAGRPRDRQGRDRDGCRPDRWHGVHRADRGQRARPAAYVHRAGRPARAARATWSRRSTATGSRARRPR